MATASLGRLTLDLVTKIGNFTGPMTQAERQAKSSSKNIANSFSVASIAATAFGAAIAGGSIGSMVAFADQTIQTGSEIKKFAQLANTSIRDFQFYAKGAETAGISMESFADKMKDMQDRIGDFQQTGGGPLADFFENIAPLVGVTIQQFQKLSGPEALQLYYDSLQKVGASQNDLKFYMEAIISDSSLLIPLLENGGEGFRKWGDAAERANAIMSDEMIETLALAKENVQLLNLQWDGLKATLVNNVVPVVQVVADNIDNVKAVAFALTAAMAVKLVPTVIATSIQLAQLAVFSVRAGVGLIGLASSGSIATGSMVALRGAMAFLGGPVGLAMLAAQGIAAASAFALMKKSSNDLKPALDSQNVSIQELVSSYEALNDSAKRSQMRFENTKLSELGNEYDDAKSKLISYVIAMGRFDDSSDSAVKAANKLAMQYKSGEITAEQLASKINALSGASDESKEKIDSQAAAVSKAKSAMDAQQKVVGALDGAKKGLNQTTRQSIVLLNEEQKAYQALTQKQRAALTGIQNQNARSQYIANNMALGWSREKAEYVADYRDEAGLDYAKRLTKYELIQLENGFKIQQQTKAREESEKKITEVKEKQLASQKKMSELVGASALSGLRIKSGESVAGGKVRNYTAEFAKLTQDALGSDLTRFTAFNDLYHKGTNSRHATGNAFDFTVKNAKEATQAVKTLEEMAKRYGFTIKAINEYKTPSGRSTGGHIHVSVLGYKGEADAVADAKAEVALVRESMEDMEQVRTEMLERQKTVRQQYFNEEEQMHEANKEAIKAIELAYAKGTPERAKYLNLQQAAYEKDVAEYQEAHKQKELSDKKQLLEAKRHWISAADYAKEYYALLREEILNTAEYSPEMKQSLVKEANFNQGLESNAERENVWSDYQSRFGVDNYMQDDIQLLQDALNQKLITEEEYFTQRAKLHTQWGQSYISGAADVMKQVLGENSKAYQAMFLMQRALALSEVLLNAPKTYSAVLASASTIPMVGPFIAPGLAAGAVALQMAQAAAIGSVSFNPAGMAHDGIDNIPKEGTWLLDKGERVVDARTNGDLKDFIANNNNGPKVIINVPAGHTANHNVGADGTVTVDVVRQEIAGAFNNVRRSNSTESRVFQETFGLSPSR